MVEGEWPNPWDLKTDPYCFFGEVFLRLPSGGYFVDGTPDGGTVVRAAVLNGLLGELSAILRLWGVDPQQTGDLPADHHQVADLLVRHWLMVGGEAPPATGLEGGAWLDTRAEPPVLHLYRDGRWQRVTWPGETTIVTSPPSTAGANFVFNDRLHGARGGGDLHALATEFTAGFLSPDGHRTLNQLQANRPRHYRSDWIPVSPGLVIQVNHELGQIPDLVQIWFRPSSAGPVRRVNGDSASLYESTPNWLRLRVGETAWSGYTANGHQLERNGEYRVVCLTHGDPS